MFIRSDPFSTRKSRGYDEYGLACFSCFPGYGLFWLIDKCVDVSECSNILTYTWLDRFIICNSAYFEERSDERLVQIKNFIRLLLTKNKDFRDHLSIEKDLLTHPIFSSL